jgi:membrane protein
VIVLLVWMYYSAQIFLLGAEFTHVYAHACGSRSDPAGTGVAADSAAPEVAIERSRSALAEALRAGARR